MINLRVPGPALWLAAAVLAVWGIVQIVDRPEPLDVPPQPPVAAAPAEVIAETAQHSAAPAMSRSVPTRIVIKSVWVNATVDQVGLARDGTIQTPSYERAANAAWYRNGPTPGEPGASVILGHVDSKTERAVFFELRRVKVGAVIEVTRADRGKVRFKVESVEQFRKTEFPTDRVYGVTPTPTLRLVTCGGKFDPKTKDYSDNIVVFASMTE